MKTFSICSPFAALFSLSLVISVAGMSNDKPKYGVCKVTDTNIYIAASVSQSSQLGGVPITLDTFPNLHSKTPVFESPITDFRAIEAEILSSSSSTLKTLKNAANVDPATPAGYSLVFGPTNGANSAAGFMGFTTINTYDVSACAQLCNARGADPNGGACQFFNIWQAVVNGTAGQTTCAFYFQPTDASTATNTGTPQLQISQSRGYSRTTLLPDGGFEDFTCACCRGPFCSTTSDATWTLVVKTTTSTFTASQILRLDGAHSGFVFATIGFFDSTNTGIWAPTSPIATVPGKNYVITLFHSLTNEGGTGSFATQFAVLWNGVSVLAPRPTDFNWHFYQVTVTAVGNDLIRFKDDLNNNQLSTSMIDDIFIFLA